MERVPIGRPGRFLTGSPAVRAGDFVFLSGHTAPDIGDDPLHFRPEEQTDSIFEQMAATLGEAGSSPDKVVKLQTFHHDLDEFPPHLLARKRAFTPPLPPSTAVECGLAHPEADVLINGIAVVNEATAETVEVDSVPRPLGPLLPGGERSSLRVPGRCAGVRLPDRGRPRGPSP